MNRESRNNWRSAPHIPEQFARGRKRHFEDDPSPASSGSEHRSHHVEVSDKVKVMGQESSCVEFKTVRSTEIKRVIYPDYRDQSNSNEWSRRHDTLSVQSTDRRNLDCPWQNTNVALDRFKKFSDDRDCNKFAENKFNEYPKERDDRTNEDCQRYIDDTTVNRQRTDLRDGYSTRSIKYDVDTHDRREDDKDMSYYRYGTGYPESYADRRFFKAGETDSFSQKHNKDVSSSYKYSKNKDVCYSSWENDVNLDSTKDDNKYFHSGEYSVRNSGMYHRRLEHVSSTPPGAGDTGIGRQRSDNSLYCRRDKVSLLSASDEAKSHSERYSDVLVRNIYEPVENYDRYLGSDKYTRSCIDRDSDVTFKGKSEAAEAQSQMFNNCAQGSINPPGNRSFGMNFNCNDQKYNDEFQLKTKNNPTFLPSLSPQGYSNVQPNSNKGIPTERDNILNSQLQPSFGIGELPLVSNSPQSSWERLYDAVVALHCSMGVKKDENVEGPRGIKKKKKNLMTVNDVITLAAGDEKKLAILNKIRACEKPCGFLIVFYMPFDQVHNSLQKTAALFNLSLNIKTERCIINKWLTKVYLNEVLIGEAYDDKEDTAKNTAIENAMNTLGKHYYTIEMTRLIAGQGKVVNTNGELITTKEDEIPKKTFSSEGDDGSELGSNESKLFKCTWLLHLNDLTKAKSAIDKYKDNHDYVDDLVFSTEFPKNPRMQLVSYAEDQGLVANVYGGVRSRHVVVSKRNDIWAIVNYLIADRPYEIIRKCKYKLHSPGQFKISHDSRDEK